MTWQDAGAAAAKTIGSAAGAAVTALPGWAVVLIAFFAHPGSKLLLVGDDAAIEILRAWVGEIIADRRDRAAIRRAAARRDQLAEVGLTLEDLRELQQPSLPPDPGVDSGGSPLAPVQARDSAAHGDALQLGAQDLERFSRPSDAVRERSDAGTPSRELSLSRSS